MNVVENLETDIFVFVLVQTIARIKGNFIVRDSDRRENRKRHED